MKYCLINKNTGVCENIIEAQHGSDWNAAGSDLMLAPDHAGEIGWTWTGSAWSDPNQQTTEQLAAKLRVRRDAALIKHCDRMSPLRWESLSDSEKTAWREFRQALLDLPEQPGWPTDITWPEKPN